MGIGFQAGITASTGNIGNHEQMPRLRGLGRALVHRNFRLFFFGQGISLVGTWMQQVATLWLVYQLTESPFLLGVVGFASQIPAVLITPVAGVLTDRWNRRYTVFAAQALAMLHAFVLMGLTLTGWITIEQTILLSILLGVVNAFDMPARQSFLIEMVEEREDLPNAIALNSSMFNAARLVGPGIAGLLIGLLGVWPCFLLNGLSYLAVLASLAKMRVKSTSRPTATTGIVDGFKEAFAYVCGSPPIRTLLVLLGVTSMVTMPLTVLMPIVASEELHGGPDTLGLLTAAIGVGALVASLFLAARTSVLGLGRLIGLSTTVLGLGMIVLSFSNNIWLWLVVLLVVGSAMVVQGAASNTVLQTIVEEDKRGRVMSFYALAFTGMAPLGSLFSGSLASRLGTMTAVLVCGIMCVAGSLIFACLLPGLRRTVRPIYVQAGILPEIATTSQNESTEVDSEAIPERRATIPLVRPLPEETREKRLAA